MELNLNIYKKLSEINRANLKSTYVLQHRLVKDYKGVLENSVHS